MESSIPVVDFSQMSVEKVTEDDSPESIQQLADEIHRAFSTVGFVYLKNHGIPQQKVREFTEKSFLFPWLYVPDYFIHPLPGHDVHHQWDSDKTASLRKGDVSTRSSSLRDVSRGGTSATQWRKFHTDDVNQYLHNKSRSHGVPNVNLFDFTFLLVDFGKVLCSSVNELQQNANASAREDYIPQILTVLFEIHRVYIWPLPPFVFYLSFVNSS